MQAKIRQNRGRMSSDEFVKNHKTKSHTASPKGEEHKKETAHRRGHRREKKKGAEKNEEKTLV